MPTYEIYKKDGTPVRVEGPEGASTEELVELYLSRRKPKSMLDTLDEYRARRAETRRRTPLTIGQQFGEGIKGIGSGVASLAESGALGLATILPEEKELVAREKIQDSFAGIQDYLAPDERVGDVSTDVPRKFGEALGSFAGILGTAAFPGVGVPAAAGLVTAAGAGEASERAREGEATEEERAKAARLGAVVGASELISPLRLLAIFKGQFGLEAAENLIERGRNILYASGEEGLQEFGAAVAQNLIEQGIYNPEQGTFAGTQEPALYGAGVGGFVQALTDMIAPRRGGRVDTPEKTEPDPAIAAAEEEVKVEDTDPAIAAAEEEVKVEDTDAAVVSKKKKKQVVVPEDARDTQKVETEQRDKVDEDAKTVYEENLKNKHYLDKEQSANDLAEFNRLTSGGMKKPEVPSLSTEDKQKVIDLVKSKPAKTIKGAANPIFRVAQVLSKDPSVENVLDNAAFMAVKGEPTSGSDLDPGRVYFVADGNQGVEAGKRVQDWVNTNLSDEGKAWFESRTKKYEAEPKPDTRGLVKPSPKKGKKVEEPVDERDIDPEVGLTPETQKEFVEESYKGAARVAEKERQEKVDKKLRRQLVIGGQDSTFIGPPQAVVQETTPSGLMVRDREKRQYDPIAEQEKKDKAQREAVKEARQTLRKRKKPFTKKDLVKEANRVLPKYLDIYLERRATGRQREEAVKFDPKKVDKAKEEKFIADLNLKGGAKRAVARAAIQKKLKADEAEAREIERMETMGQEDTLGEIDAPLDTTALLNELKLDKDAVENLDVTLDRSTIDLLVQGDLKGGLQSLAATSTNPTIKRIASKLAEKIGDTKIAARSNLTLEGKPIAGAFDPTVNTIFIDDNYMIPHVLLHEATHAVTSATIANKSHPLTRRLTNIFEGVKDQLDTAYGSKNLDEFVAETFSNPEFQRKLARTRIKGFGIDALRQFARDIGNFLKKMVGLKPRDPLATDTIASDLIESILAPAPESRDAGLLLSNLGAKGTKEVFDDAIGEEQTTKTYMDEQEKSTYVDKVKEFLFNGSIAETAKDFFTSFADALVITDVADGIGFDGLGEQLMDRLQRQRGDLERAGGIFKEKLTEVTKILKAKKGLEAKLDDVIYSMEYGATIYQVDPTKKESDYINKDGTDKLEDGNNLRQIWKNQQKAWQALGPDGQEAYKIMQKHYKDEYKKIEALLYKQVEEATDTATAGKVQNDVFNKLFSKEILDVYFPLTREGNYAVTFQLKEPKPTGDTKVVVFVDTSDAAQRFVARLNKDSRVIEGSAKGGKIEEINKFFREAPPTEFVGQVLEAVGKVKDPAEKARLEEEVVRLFVNVLPESSFARSLIKREGVPGFIGSSVQAFKTKGFSIGRQVAQLENGKKFRELRSNIRTKAQELLRKPEQRRFAPSVSRVAGELDKRIDFATKGANAKQFEKFVKAANQSAFIYTIGLNVSSAMVNLSQIPLVVYPYLGAEYGLGTSFKTVGKAYKMVANGANSMNAYFKYDPKTETYVMRDTIVTSKGKERAIRPNEKKAVGAFKPIIQAAEDRGQLTKSFILDALGLGETGKAYGNMLDKTTGLTAIFFQGAERYNRQVTLLTAYELALRKEVGDFKTSSFAEVAEKATKEQQTKATEKALRQSLELNGGSVLETAPRISQQGFGRIAMMYKTYGVRMYTTLFKTTRELLRTDKALNNEDRKLAFKQLIAVHGSALFFAGVHGIPLYGAVEVAYNLLLADDEEDDFDTMIRKNVGEEYFKGAVNLITGMDVASRIRLTGLLIQENRYNKDATFEENAFFYLGGPAFSTFDRVVNRGVAKLFIEGEFERSLENIVPPAIANVWKGTFGRTAREGYMTRRGDAIYGDPSFSDIAGSVFGFPPVEYTLQMERNNIEKGVDNAINKKKSKLLRRLYVTMRQGDLDGYDDALEAIMEHNARHPLSAITPDSIKRSLKRHMETSKNIAKHRGVAISPQNQEIIRLREMEYDSDYNFESLFGD